MASVITHRERKVAVEIGLEQDYFAISIALFRLNCLIALFFIMSSRNLMKTQLCFSTVATVFCLYQSSAFGQFTRDLDKITQSEIVPKTVELIQGNASNTALSTPYFATQVERQIQIKIPTKSSTCPPILNVNYFWMSGDTKSGPLSHKGSQIIATILSKTETCTPGVSPEPAVVEINAELRLDFPSIKSSGTYSGKLLVTVE
ncbi:hypothetical protein JYQ62_37080 [Nostoc sp. UHCC 0702]|nr:hypothetical protein JYQ62_37080 [Nostoc sp. UHCC 0702]